MDVATDTLEFLDLKLKLIKNLNKFLRICLLNKPTALHMFSLVRVFLKITLKTSIKVALCLRRICDSDEKFEKHSAEYQNH